MFENFRLHENKAARIFEEIEVVPLECSFEKIMKVIKDIPKKYFGNLLNDVSYKIYRRITYDSTSLRIEGFVTAAMYFIITLEASVLPEPLSPKQGK